MGKRKLCAGGCLKEEGGGADVLSEEPGLWMGFQHVEGGKDLTTSPSTHLTALVCLHHVSTYINKLACAPPPLSKPLEKGTGTSSRALP